MTRNAWESRPAANTDLTVRCNGKRLIEISAGNPAPLRAVRMAEHQSQELLLSVHGMALNALAQSVAVDLPARFTWLERREFSCPNHKEGHFVGAAKLWRELQEARRSRRTRSIEVRLVVEPYYDEQAPDT